MIVTSLSSDPVAAMSARMREIASGKKSFQTAPPSDIAISSRMMAAYGMESAQSRNDLNATSLEQTRSSWLDATQSTLARLGEISVKAGSGILSSADRANLQTEADQLVQGLGDIRRDARFNGQQLLDDPSFTDMLSSISGQDVSSSSFATAVSDGIEAISSRQAETGSELRRLDMRYSQSLSTQENLMKTGSRLGDADLSESFLAFTQNAILSQVQLAMQAQGQKMESDRIKSLIG
ncbi:MAG: hypothetical protein RL095_3333 [Verrucomicrobiota bacterium]|jgi:flagellin